ncbi:MAG: hypothetical protein MMC33_006705 [Icmadophila ericetorum]|nr:hypothetical protein [Icmadophila ericetorum]
MVSSNAPVIETLSPSFLSLPTELKQHILSLLPDLASVERAILVHPSLYQSFIGAESVIITHILKRQIGSKLITLVEDVADAATINPWSRERMSSLLCRIFIRNKHYKSYLGAQYQRAYKLSVLEKQQRKWTLRHALHAAELHRDVEYFSRDFADCTLGTIRTPLSDNEKHRIKRSFYIFELYCTAFRRRKYRELADPEQASRFSIESQRHFFLRNFPSWQLEQIACVYEYLKTHITPAFDDVAQHDVEWGHQFIDWMDENNTHKEFVVSQGLAYLRKLGAETSYDDRYQLLLNVTSSPSESRYVLHDQSFFHAAMSPHAPQNYSLIEYLDKMEDGVQVESQTLLVASHLENYLLADPDVGPFYAWLWAHRSLPNVMVYFDPDQKRIRSRGYVMWDRARLSRRWGKLSNPWRRPRLNVNDEIERLKQKVEMRVGFQERSWIFRSGGRGWWSEADKTKVVWPEMYQTQAEKNCKELTGLPLGSVSETKRTERIEVEPVPPDPAPRQEP